MSGFQNPIIAGEELVRNAIRSNNYVAGTNGWRISRDGNADFQNVNTSGNVSVDQLSANKILYGGNDLQSLIDQLPKGIVAFGEWFNVGERNWGVGANGPICLVNFTVKAGRHYVIRVVGLEADSTTAGRTVEYSLRSTTDGSTPTLANSTLIAGGRCVRAYSKRNWSNTIELEGHWWNAGTTDINVKAGMFLTTGESDTTSSSITYVGNPSAVVCVEDRGLYIGHVNAGFQDPSVVVAPVQTYTTEWYSTSVQSYQSNNTFSPANGANTLGYQGDGTAVGNPGGNSASHFFFNSADMRAQLAGATILNTYIYTKNTHSYYNTGATARVGTHNFDPTPGTFGSANVRRWNQTTAEGGSIWSGSVGVGLGQEFRDGVTRGICLGYSSPASLADYSTWSQVGVRITYQK